MTASLPSEVGTLSLHRLVGGGLRVGISPADLAKAPCWFPGNHTSKIEAKPRFSQAVYNPTGFTDPLWVPSLFVDLYPELEDDEEAQARLQAWLKVQVVIAATLRIPFEDWNEFYLGYCFEHPFDYAFADGIDLTWSPEQLENLRSSFERVKEAVFSPMKKIPLRAKNNLGKLSPKTQDAVGALLEGGRKETITLPPSDVAHLQKMFASEKPLAKLKRANFRKVEISRDEDVIVCGLSGGEILFRMAVVEFSAVLSKKVL